MHSAALVGGGYIFEHTAGRAAAAHAVHHQAQIVMGGRHPLAKRPVVQCRDGVARDNPHGLLRLESCAPHDSSGREGVFGKIQLHRSSSRPSYDASLYQRRVHAAHHKGDVGRLPMTFARQDQGA